MVNLNEMGRIKTESSKSKYYGVSFVKPRTNGSKSLIDLRAEFLWHASVKRRSIYLSKYFKTEEEAAKAVDLCLIQNGQQPVNILTPKKVETNKGRYYWA